MPLARFCSACGQKINRRRATILPGRALCPECKPRIPAIQFAGLIGLVICSLIGFTLGRYTAPSAPFNFIGTPVNLEARSLTTNQLKPHSNETVETPTATEAFITLCAAPTKAGHPCRRKVHGWGYCWQHRDKFGKKPLPKEPELLQKIEKAPVVLQ